MTARNFANPGLLVRSIANSTPQRPRKRRIKLNIVLQVLAAALLTLVIGLATWNVGV